MRRTLVLGMAALLTFIGYASYTTRRAPVPTRDSMPLSTTEDLVSIRIDPYLQTTPTARVYTVEVVSEKKYVIEMMGGEQLGKGECPEAPQFELLPSTWACPVIPVCGTQYGLCRWPYWAAAGQPCQCRAADGAWVPGVVLRGSVR